MFWSNHFCVSANKGAVRGIAGAYRARGDPPARARPLRRHAARGREAPGDARSIWTTRCPSAPTAGRGRTAACGLNENLAREILELHTLGVGGGYTQGDVTNLARILTGWTVGNLGNPLTEPGKFFFAPPRHEPGEWTVLGKRYPDRGLQTGEKVLRALAAHPATARHIARKLAAHFVAEEPPPALVARLEKTFLDTGGDLARRRQGAGAGERGVGARKPSRCCRPTTSWSP